MQPKRLQLINEESKRLLRSHAPNAVCQAHMHRLAQRGARQLLGTCLADLCEEMMAKRQGRALKRQVRCLNYSTSLFLRKTVPVSIRGHTPFRLMTHDHLDKTQVDASL